MAEDDINFDELISNLENQDIDNYKKFSKNNDNHKDSIAEFENDKTEMPKAFNTIEANESLNQSDPFDQLKSRYDQQNNSTIDNSNQNQTSATSNKSYSSSDADELLNNQILQAKASKVANLDGVRNLETLHALPINVSVVLGKSELIISDLLLMGQGSVIELDKLIGDDLDVFVNGKPIAQGTIVLSNNNFGCKISRILTPIERLRKLIMEN